MGDMIKNVAPAVNIGSKLKILTPTNDTQEMHPIESTITKCLVKDLQPGFVVAQIDGTSFATLRSTATPTLYIVISTSPYILKNIQDSSPACIRNPDLEIYVLNRYGIATLNVSNVDGVNVCAPITHDTTKEVISKDGDVMSNNSSNSGQVASAAGSTSAQAAAPAGKGELIFNFMGLVWGTNDTNPDHQQWMQEATK